MLRQVADLHCDLLAYLAMGTGRTIHDPASRCSLEQMKLGGVKTQILPIYVPNTRQTPQMGLAQVEAFDGLITEYAEHFRHRFGPPSDDLRIDIALAVENAAAFFGDNEPLKVGLARIRAAHEHIGPLVYVSLTWALENRFGGGNGAQEVGLKPDGQALVEHLVSLGIPIDLSHTSDKLAVDLLTLIDKRLPEARIMASHCNLRSIKSHKRNLPDEIAQEIARRDGIIGLNLIRAFVGKGIEDFPRHVEHALSLGLEDNICLGADFFCPEDLPTKPKDSDRFFLTGFGTAESHPALQTLLLEAGLDGARLDKLINANLERWLADLTPREA